MKLPRRFHTYISKYKIAQTHNYSYDYNPSRKQLEKPSYKSLEFEQPVQFSEVFQDDIY